MLLSNLTPSEKTEITALLILSITLIILDLIDLLKKTQIDIAIIPPRT